MSGTLSLRDLSTASQPGGATALAVRTELVPAAGEFASIAPAKFVRGSDPAYAFEQRFVDGELVDTVLIDSKQSQLNRVEKALSLAIEDGNPVLSKTPRMSLTYADRDGDELTLTDLDVPHRAFDAHLRAGTVDGEPVVRSEKYRAARNASPANARGMLEMSPGSLVFGSWDATRKSRQGRWRSVLVGEIIGVLPGGQLEQPDHKGGARVDPVAMQIKLPGGILKELAEAQRHELSEKNFNAIVKEAGKAKKGELVSASKLGFGGVPPALNQLAGVACSRIIRSHVLSFAALRQIRFGAGAEGDAACRALLAAYAIAGLTRSNEELNLRANCDLREQSPTIGELDQRGGKVRTVELPTVEAADAILEEAIESARELAGITWDGQVFAVVGNPQVLAGLEDTDEE